MINFSCTERRLININTGNEYIDAAISTAQNAIGEKKKIRFYYQAADPATGAPQDISGCDFYINVALFMPKTAINPISGKGSVYWSAAIPDGTTSGTFECSLNTFLFSEAQKNYKVRIVVIDISHIYVEIDFYQTFDVLGYVSNLSAIENQFRFTKDRFTNRSEGVVSGSSIYNSNEYDGRVYLYAEKHTDTSNNGSIEKLFGDYKASFYGTSGDVSLTQKYYVNGDIEVKSLSPLKKTKVEFTIHAPYRPTAHVVMFKQNNADNSIDFIEAYAAEFAKIIPSTANQSRLVGPFVAPVETDASTYVGSFFVEEGSIDFGQQWSFLYLLYTEEGTVVSSHHIRGDYTSAEVPFNGQGFDVDARLSDYHREFTGNNLECVIEERMRSKLRLNFPAEKYKQDIFNRLGIVIPNDITTYLTKIDFKIFNTTSSFFVTTTNYLEELTLQKFAPQSYIGNPGISIQIGAEDYIELWADWRNRYEAGVDCIRSLINGIDFGTKLTNQYWGGKTLKCEWTLYFYYDNFVTPFTDVVTFKQQIRVKDYEPAEVSILAQNEADENKEFWCPEDVICLKAIKLGDDDYRLINTIEPDPGSITTIEEAEAWVGDELVQLTTSKIFNQEISYGQTLPTAAKFCISAPQLLLNSQYKISAMAKRYYERCRRSTEIYDPRKTEVIQQRVPEQCSN